MSLHQDLISLRRNQGQMDIFTLMLLTKQIKMHNLLKLTCNYLTLGIRPLDSREISNELYFRIREGVEEKEGASIDQSIIPLSILMRETKISCYKLRQSFLA